jgi:hypothetical protein
MPSALLSELLPDLEIADLTFGSKAWDRRRSDQTKKWAEVCLDHAVTYLIEDQMSEHRVFWPGAMSAVEVLREAVAAIRSDAALEERAGRVAASWLPKYTLARHARLGDSDA